MCCRPLPRAIPPGYSQIGVISPLGGKPVQRRYWGRRLQLRFVAWLAMLTTFLCRSRRSENATSPVPWGATWSKKPLTMQPTTGTNGAGFLGSAELAKVAAGDRPPPRDRTPSRRRRRLDTWVCARRHAQPQPGQMWPRLRRRSAAQSDGAGWRGQRARGRGLVGQLTGSWLLGDFSSSDFGRYRAGAEGHAQSIILSRTRQSADAHHLRLGGVARSRLASLQPLHRGAHFVHQTADHGRPGAGSRGITTAAIKASNNSPEMVREDSGGTVVCAVIGTLG